ncbi:hypothetical protein ANCCEY_02325 [Ancylostoma ceylanicum]|uniref:Reverse transcriptase domain-containing protein n=1 Tax=Ancylostoma ceylanicum TaxID=53326 RepID=A0A0D6M2W2_9BILA|nr:hypothetical protein ANCCEY_02325 [Ancylostoma ceylanicum]
MDHIHTVIRLIEVSREYKMPLCLTFIDLKEPFDTVETEAVLEALGNQGVPTQYIRLFRELYSNFTTRISPFYDDITIDVRRGVRQDDTVSPKLFTATLEEGREVNMINDLAPELGRRKLAALGAYKSIEDVVKKTKNIRLRAHLFNTTERNRRLYQFRSLHATEYPNTPQESGHAKTPVVAPVQNKVTIRAIVQEQQTKQAQPEGEVPANYPKPSDIVFEANKKKKEKAHCNGDLFFEKR